MRLTRYGLDVVFRMLLIAGALITCALLFVRVDAIKYALIGVVAVLVILVLNFFRDPERRTPAGNGCILSPADGRVVIIKNGFEPEYLQQEAVQISIFMSPLDVHVNRIPVSGTIQYVKHVRGEFTAAFKEKSSDANERLLIGMECGNGQKIFFKQIAGAVARRIVAEVAVGQSRENGERFGMIKFGSRVDIFLPKDSNIQVQLHDRVIAGESILATFSTKA